MLVRWNKFSLELDNMKVYIASTLSNGERVAKLRDKLQNLGIEITYDWTAHGMVLEPSDLDEIAAQELQGVIDADHLFVVLPGGKGTHVELGAMIAMHLDKYEFPITILHDVVDTPFPTSFHYLRSGSGVPIYRTDSEDDAIERLGQIHEVGPDTYQEIICGMDSNAKEMRSWFPEIEIAADEDSE